MGKKKKLLLQYKRFGKVSKKLEKKFASFLQANFETFTTKVEETLDKVEEFIDTTQETMEPVKVEETPAPAEEPTAEIKAEEERPVKKRAPAKKSAVSTIKKSTSTARRRRASKTKTDT